MLSFPKIPFGSFIFWLLLMILAYLTFSCTPLRRLELLERRHPYLFNRMIDTLTVTDTFTVIVPGVKADTAVQLFRLKDTVTLHKDQLTVRVYQYHDSIYISGSCDTIFKEVIRTIEVPYVKNESYRRPRDGLLWGFIPICLIALFFVIIEKSYEKLQKRKKEKESG